jgi:AhpD family alkylhydroperoxidase
MSTQTTPVLSPKEEALVGVALSVANGCKPCTQRYVKAATEAGACKRGIQLAIESALMARKQATEDMAQWAQSLQGDKPVLDEAFVAPKALWQAIYAAGSAYGQHDATGFETKASAALALGATRHQLTAVLAQSRAIAATAGKHVEAAFQNLGLTAPGPSEAAETARGCGCSSC